MADFFPTTIKDVEHYNKEMKKSLIDKAFFLDKVESEIFVDFGCADGILLQFMEMLFPDNIYIGYDISEQELDIAKSNTNAKLFSNWNKLLEYLNTIRDGKKVTVICNSLIHEVYSYSSKDEVDLFWQQIFTSGFDYIVIRDMSVSRTTSRPSDPISVAKIRQRFKNGDMLHQFEEEWGNINENWSLVHFLLKYRYVYNWEREIKENYLPLNYENLLALIPNNYDPVHIEHFTVPWIRNKIYEDFGIDLQDRTHVKLILKRNYYE